MATTQSCKRDGKLNAKSTAGLGRLIDEVYSAAAGERPWDELAPEIARTSSGSYKALDQRRVSRLLPHLQRALRMWEQLGYASLLTGASVEVLARCPAAALVVTADARLLYANSKAIDMLEEGSAIRSRQGRISANRDTDAAQLLALIRAASDATAGSNPQEGVMLAHRPSGAAVSLLVAPFSVSIPGHAWAGAIVFIRDPAKTVLERGTLQTLFGLTPTESRIAAAMARGRSVEAIAANQHASLQTVRKQVKAIFAKTGTHRQAECVAMLLSSVAAMDRN